MIVQMNTSPNSIDTKLTRFTVDIKGTCLFRNANGIQKSITDWSPQFRRIVFAMSRMPCAWSINRSRMAGNEFTVSCHCLERKCGAKLFAITQNGHSSMTVYITPYDKSIKNEKKTHIRGQERMKIVEMLKVDKAKVVAAKLANEYLRIGDIEPLFMPNNDALRKMRSGKYDHLIYHEDPLNSLQKMKYVEPYMNSIGNIGMDPFECFFCTPYQRELVRIESNRRKIIICYDATGAPVTAPTNSSYHIETGKYKPIFRYVIMIQNETGENLPVFSSVDTATRC